MKYRPEIDGLRTIAVVPVVLYHAGFGIFPGGFLGVDVFFVISGFLITRIISEEISEGRFSILNFYERRARRILPSLFVVLAVTTLAAVLLLYPLDFKPYGQSLVATTVFLSNVFFYLKSDYFSPATELLPLVHTWSLAVEEQFYIFFPLLLLALRRVRQRVVFATVLVISVLSLALAHAMISWDAAAAFYLLPTRAWELGAGALCAMWVLRRGRPTNSYAAGLGLLMIAASMVVYDTATPTPSLYTLLPVVGASLVVLCGGTGGLAGRLLSSAPMVGIGLVSYSAYLWHQPLMALTRDALGLEPAWPVMLFLCVITFVLAYGSWLFVESPFRRRGHGPTPTMRSAFVASGAGLVAFFLIGLSVHAMQGFPGRVSEPVARILAGSNDLSPQTATCLVTIDARATLPDIAPESCIWEAPGGEAKGSVVLIGDSHANAFAGALSESLPAAGYDLRQLTIRGCAPFPGFRKDGSNRDCHSGNEAVLEKLKELQPDRIIVSWRGTSMFADQFDNEEGGVDLQRYAGMELQRDYYPDLVGLDAETQALEIFRRGLMRLSEIAPLIVVGPVPEAGWDVPHRYARLSSWSEVSELSTSREVFEERQAGVLELLGELEAQERMRVVYTHRQLCNEDRCLNAVGEDLYYSDDDHLSNTGAGVVAPSIVEALDTSFSS